MLINKTLLASPLPPVLIITVLVMALGWSGKTAAGAADVKDQSGNSMKFEYDGPQRVRVNSSGDNNYMLVLADKVYAVSNEGGQTIVMDMGEAYRMFGRQFQTAGPGEAAGKFISLTRTSGTTTVAGVTGDNYELRYIDDKGAEQVSPVVLSSDRRAREFTTALLGMTTSMASIIGQNENAGGELKRELDKRGVGVIRWGENMELTAISDRKIAATRFELPAAPTDLSALGNLGAVMGGAAAPTDEDVQDDASSGGIFSRVMGSLGGKADETQDRAEDSVEDEVDERTDDAIDSAVDKAFGKIFGK